MKYRLKLLVFFILITNGIEISAQDKEYIGTYIHVLQEDTSLFRTNRLFEEIKLYSNGFFEYTSKQNPIQTLRGCQIKGNWKTRGDTLIMDSHPQKSRINEIVYLHKRKRKRKKIRFTVMVKDFQGRQVYDCRLYLINDNSQDTLMLRDKKGIFKIKNKKFSSYYVGGGYGNIKSSNLPLPSSGYETRVKKINISFYPYRVFENERWIFTQKGLKSKNSSGDYKPYYLIRQKDNN